MALDGSRASIPDMGNQLYSYEKRAAVIFSLSAGFPPDSYLINLPSFS